jgi:hypothetical protein
MRLSSIGGINVKKRDDAGRSGWSWFSRHRNTLNRVAGHMKPPARVNKRISAFYSSMLNRQKLAVWTSKFDGGKRLSRSAGRLKSRIFELMGSAATRTVASFMVMTAPGAFNFSEASDPTLRQKGEGNNGNQHKF